MAAGQTLTLSLNPAQSASVTMACSGQGPVPQATWMGAWDWGAAGQAGPGSPRRASLFISPQGPPRPRRSAGESLTRVRDMEEKEGESPDPSPSLDFSSAWRPSPVLPSQLSTPRSPLCGRPSQTHPYPLLRPFYLINY
jgi:hypothetical protein